jgi:myo-inositol-1(or 4)-monophosphatase
VARWLFSACFGRGAWLNDRPLGVRPRALSRASLIAVGTTCEPGLPPFTEEWLRRYRVRRTGSTALHLCYVAMGALDLVHDHRTLLREIAGAATILMEAGGVVTRYDGKPVFPATSAELAGRPLALLAGNPVSHREALADVPAVSPKIYGAVIVP